MRLSSRSSVSCSRKLGPTPSRRRTDHSQTLFTFSLQDFWMLLPFLSDRSVFIPSNTCAENSAIAGKIKKNQKSSLIITVSGSTPTPWSGPFRDHGLDPPLSTENPRNKGFSGSGAPIFGFGLADPALKG